MPKHERRAVRSLAAPQPDAAYSQAIRSGGWIFVAGQGPFDPETGTLVGESIEEQVRRTLANIEAILRSAGAALGDVVRTTAFLSDLRLFDRFDGVYATFFSEPFPARTTVGVELPQALIEIDAIACLE